MFISTADVREARQRGGGEAILGEEESQQRTVSGRLAESWQTENVFSHVTADYIHSGVGKEQEETEMRGRDERGKLPCCSRDKGHSSQKQYCYWLLIYTVWPTLMHFWLNGFTTLLFFTFLIKGCESFFHRCYSTFICLYASVLVLVFAAVTL